jgi:hypothetical protein
VVVEGGKVLMDWVHAAVSLLRVLLKSLCFGLFASGWHLWSLILFHAVAVKV